MDEIYYNLLEKAEKKLPENVKEHFRFKFPESDIFFEGNTTVFRNIIEVADVFNRDPNHIMSYLLRELGTSGEITGRRAIFKGRIPIEQIKYKIHEYTNNFVFCKVCGKPDTHVEQEETILILKCHACGVRTPITVKATEAVK